MKTDSEVLRVEMSDIAKIETSKEEYEAKARRALHPDIVATAEAAAEAEVDKVLWFGVGCALNFVGVFVASSVKPSPPGLHLIGKSPEYVAEYTEAFQPKAKSIQTNMASLGCAVYSICVGGVVFFGYQVTKDLR